MGYLWQSLWYVAPNSSYSPSSSPGKKLKLCYQKNNYFICSRTKSCKWTKLSGQWFNWQIGSQNCHPKTMKEEVFFFFKMCHALSFKKLTILYASSILITDEWLNHSLSEMQNWYFIIIHFLHYWLQDEDGLSVLQLMGFSYGGWHF